MVNEEWPRAFGDLPSLLEARFYLADYLMWNMPSVLYNQIRPATLLAEPRAAVSAQFPVGQHIGGTWHIRGTYVHVVQCFMLSAYIAIASPDLSAFCARLFALSCVFVIRIVFVRMMHGPVVSTHAGLSATTGVSQRRQVVRRRHRGQAPCPERGVGAHHACRGVPEQAVRGEAAGHALFLAT